MLGRVEKVHANPDLAIRRRLYETMHEVAVARFPESVDALLPFNLQARSRLLRAGDFDALAALADTETALRARVRATGVTPGPVAEVRMRAELEGLRFTRDGDRLLWEGADAAAALAAGSTLQLLLKQRATQEETGRPPRSRPSWSTGPAACAPC